MKNIFFLLVSLSILSGSAQAHDPTEGPVALEPEALNATAGHIAYEFQLVDTKSDTLITDRDLNSSHEKKLHFLAYDPALKEFRHVHPEYNGRLWTVNLELSVNGKYWLWAQGELIKGQAEFSAGNRLNVSGGKAAWPAPPALRDARDGTDGNSRATLSSTRVKAGKVAMLTLTFSRADGSNPEITPLLGAFAHVAAVPDDGDSLLHVHPMDGTKPTEGILHLTFPEAGFYRVWVQWMDGGQLRIVPLSVQVF